MTFEEFIEFTKAQMPNVKIEDLINQSINPVMLLDNIYRMEWQGPTIGSYNYEKQVEIGKITALLSKRIDGYSYESVVQEVMSLFEH